jgi:hypothetical protein
MTRLAIMMVAFAHTAGADVTVSSTPDQKAMGYPDGRKIVRDSNGNLYVAFRGKLVSSVYEIYVSKSTDGGANWSVMNGGSYISTNSSGVNQRVPSIAIDSADNLHVVWYGCDNSSTCVDQRVIKYQKYDAVNGTWLASRKIIGSPGSYPGSGPWQEHPVLYVHSNDNLFVVWEGNDSTHSDPQVRYNTSTDGGATWANSTGTVVKACAGPGNGCPQNQSRPTVVVDSNGKMFVFAYGWWPDSDSQNIIYSTNLSGSFSAWDAAAPETDINQEYPSAAIDSGNKIHLVWRQGAETSPTLSAIRYSKYTPGSGFNASVAIAQLSSTFQLFPSIANYNAKLHVVWVETSSISNWPSEEPTSGKIVYGYKSCSTCSWTTSDITSSGSNVWSTIRWSFDTMNGGDIDVVYGTGSGPYDIMYHSGGALP